MRNKLGYFVLALAALLSAGAILLMNVEVRGKSDGEKNNQAESKLQQSRNQNPKVGVQSTQADGRSQGNATHGETKAESFAVPIPKGTRKETKGDKVTACTPAYEDIIELTDNPELKDSLAGKITEACPKELSAVIRDFDALVKDLTTCGKNKNKSQDETQECLRLGNIFRTAFVENEFKEMEPSDIPSPVLRSMIVFRLMQMESYSKSESDIHYFYRLVSEEQKLSPDRNMAPLKTLLMGNLLKSNPEKYEHDIEQTLMDLERTDPEAVLTTRLARFDYNLKNPDLQANVEEFIQRNPNSGLGYYIKAAIHASREDWSAVDPLMNKAIILGKDKEFYEAERKKFAAKGQGISVTHHINFSF